VLREKTGFPRVNNQVMPPDNQRTHNQGVMGAELTIICCCLNDEFGDGAEALAGGYRDGVTEWGEGLGSPGGSVRCKVRA
jgi:hypothetical protein